MFDVTDGYLPLIAVGKPGGSQELTGGLVYRDYLKDENWQTYVREKILAADSIVLLLNSTGGVLWELEIVLSHSAFAKTIFLIDPRAKDNEVWQNLTKRIIPMFAKASVLAPDFQFAGHPMGFYFSRDGLVEIENNNWSATSTLGSALPIWLERPQGAQGIAQPLSLSPMTSGTVARMRPSISGSLTSVTVPRYFP